MKKLYFVAILAIAGTTMLLQGCSQTGVKVGKPGPAWETVTLAGVHLNSDELKGSYVLMYFWGTSCDACRAENPPLMEVFESFRDARFKHASDFKIVGIALNSNALDCRRIIREDKLKIRHHILYNTPAEQMYDAPMAKLYGIKKIPTRILLDENGVVLGVDLSVEEVDQLLHSKLL